MLSDSSQKFKFDFHVLLGQEQYFTVAWNEGSKKLRPLWRLHLCVAGKHRCHGFPSWSCRNHCWPVKFWTIPVESVCCQGDHKGEGEMEKRGDFGGRWREGKWGELKQQDFVCIHFRIWAPFLIKTRLLQEPCFHSSGSLALQQKAESICVSFFEWKTRPKHLCSAFHLLMFH